MKDENKATVDSISKYTTDMILVIVGNYYGQSDLLRGSVQQIKFVLVPRAVNEKMVEKQKADHPPFQYNFNQYTQMAPKLEKIWLYRMKLSHCYYVLLN